MTTQYEKVNFTQAGVFLQKLIDLGKRDKGTLYEDAEVEQDCSQRKR